MELEEITCQVNDEFGWINISEVARRAQRDRKTVRKYLQQGFAPVAKTERKQNRSGKLDNFKEYINYRLNNYPKLSGKRIFAEIQAKGYDGKLTILRDYIRSVRPSIQHERTDAVLRYETKSGQQAQIDWVTIGKVIIDGESRTVYAFVMVLSYSRMRYARLTLSQDTCTLIQCIQSGFEYFGGVPKELLFDNMKTVVVNRGNSEKNRQYNLMFYDFKKHYDFRIRLCKPYQPQTKGKIERLVSYFKSDFAYGRTFASLSEANTAVQKWLDQVNREEHGTTHKIPIDELPAELANMRDISSIPRFIVASVETRTVTADSYVSYLSNMYSVPMNYARKQVTLRIYDTEFDVVYNNKIICTHPIVAGHNRLIRVPEHFNGLLSIAIKRNNKSIQKNKLQGMVQPFIDDSSLQVQRRSLDEYDKYAFLGDNK